MPYVRIAPGANPDPHAVALARDVHVAVQPDVVILYGSRARGDHRPDSDVDLLVILTGSLESRPNLNPPVPESPHDVSFLIRNLDWFQRCRRARNHVAARAMREGVVIGGKYWTFQSTLMTDTRTAGLTSSTSCNGPMTTFD